MAWANIFSAFIQVFALEHVRFKQVLLYMQTLEKDCFHKTEYLWSGKSEALRNIYDRCISICDKASHMVSSY